MAKPTKASAQAIGARKRAQAAGAVGASADVGSDARGQGGAPSASSAPQDRGAAAVAVPVPPDTDRRSVAACLVGGFAIMALPALLVGIVLAEGYTEGGMGYALPTLAVGALAITGALLKPSCRARRALLALAAVGALALAMTYSADFAATSARYVPAQSDEERGRYRDNIDSTEYVPFASARIARLDEASTLQFAVDDALPVIDGAAALLPVYSAFATATYPEGPTTMNLNEGEGYRYVEATSTSSGSGDAAPKPRTVIQYNNTPLGYRSLAEGGTDVFFGAHPSEEQLAYAREKCGGLDLTPIGREAFVFIVSADAPVDSLTAEQVRAIYRGDITDWSQVGGKPGPIHAYQRNEGSGSQTQMLRFMEGEPLVDPPLSRVQGLMSGLVDAVASYDNGEGAIGYSFRYYVEGILGERGVKALAIDGVAPTADNIANGRYPITVELYAATRAGELAGTRADGSPANSNIARLVEWATGPQGQSLVAASGYVSLQ